MDKQTPTVAVVIAGSLDEWLHTARERRMFDSSCPQITYAFTEAPAPPLGQARTPAERTALLDRLTAVEWNEAYESLCGRPGNGTTSPRLGQDLCLEPADIDPFEVLFTEGGCQQHRFRVQAPGRPATSLIGEFGVIPMPDGRSAAGIWLTLFPHTEQACGAAASLDGKGTAGMDGVASGTLGSLGAVGHADLRKVSHGLHNALAGIHQVLQLLLPKLPDDEINQELATYCHESLQRANQLANEMRELIKGAGRGSVAVKGLCEGAVAALADEGTGAAVTVSCPADVDYGGDAAALIQLLRGLLKDAPVALATSAPLRLSAEPGPGRLVFRVESEQRAAPPGGPSNVEGEDGSASDEGPVPLDPACHALALQLGGRLLLERTPVRSITLDVPNPAQPLV